MCTVINLKVQYAYMISGFNSKEGFITVYCLLFVFLQEIIDHRFLRCTRVENGQYQYYGHLISCNDQKPEG